VLSNPRRQRPEEKVAVATQVAWAMLELRQRHPGSHPEMAVSHKFLHKLAGESGAGRSNWGHHSAGMERVNSTKGQVFEIWRTG